MFEIKVYLIEIMQFKSRMPVLLKTLYRSLPKLLMNDFISLTPAFPKPHQTYIKRFEYCKPKHCSSIFEGSITYCVLFWGTFCCPYKLSKNRILYTWHKCYMKRVPAHFSIYLRYLLDFELKPMNFFKVVSKLISVLFRYILDYLIIHTFQNQLLQ